MRIGGAYKVLVSVIRQNVQAERTTCWVVATPVGGSPVKVSATGGLVRVSADTVPYDLVLKAVAKQLEEASIGLEFLTGELQGSHDPSGVVFSVLAALSGSTVISLDRIEVYGGMAKAGNLARKWQKWPAE
ncbi:hypothetical protein [Nonomuraea fuscirosea]|uniref:hypothetical protein n=1 Tax=Nonomuraea fuscirosea TaxID=1291556 RepID=UPI0033F9116E